MSTSLEISNLFGGPEEPTGRAFNDYNVVRGKRQKISKISLYESGGQVVGVKVVYDVFGNIGHGKTDGTRTDVSVSGRHIIAAFVAVDKTTNKITSVYFNVSNMGAAGEPAQRLGMDAPDPTANMIHTTFGNIIAVHGTVTTGDEKLESLGFQVLTTR